MFHDNFYLSLSQDTNDFFLVFFFFFLGICGFNPRFWQKILRNQNSIFIVILTIT
jgi:hypothetical protein